MLIFNGILTNNNYIWWGWMGCDMGLNGSHFIDRSPTKDLGVPTKIQNLHSENLHRSCSYSSEQNNFTPKLIIKHLFMIANFGVCPGFIYLSVNNPILSDMYLSLSICVSWFWILKLRIPWAFPETFAEIKLHGFPVFFLRSIQSLHPLTITSRRWLITNLINW